MLTTDVLRQVALNSDHSTIKLAALIVCKDTGIIKACGFNSKKPGVIEDRVMYSVNPNWIHAEEMAINRARDRGINGKDMKMICSWHPCEFCCNLIRGYGITDVEYEKLSYYPSSWYYARLVGLECILHHPYDIFKRI